MFVYSYMCVKQSSNGAVPIIVFYTKYSGTLSNYTPDCHGLNIGPGTLSGSAIFEASDESCTP